MVSFVEQATLRVNDQSTRKINTINSALQRLFQTARNGRNLNIKVNGLEAAARDARAVTTAIRQIPRSYTTRINGLGAAVTQASAVASTIRSIPTNRNIRLNVSQTGGGAVPGASGGVRSIGVNTTGLTNALNGFTSRLAFTIEDAIIRGFAQATIERDVSATSLALLNLPPEQEAAAIATAGTISDSNPQFNEGQVRGVLAEVLRTTRFDQGAAAILTQQAVELARLQVLQGEDAGKAINSAFEFVKAAEQSGNVTDLEGNFNEQIAGEFFDTIKRNIIGGGREITAELVRSLTKSLRVSRFGLDARGFTTALALAEEQGSTAGVGLNQAIKQLSGQGQAKFRIANLADLGLLNTEEIVTGTVGGINITETRANNPVDNDLLRRDPAAWVRQNLIPALQAAGVDTNSPTEVSLAVNDIVGDRTAVESVTSLVLRSDELLKQGDLVSGLNVTPEFLNSLESQSTTSALATAEAGLTDILGAVGESFESILIPALEAIGGIATSLSNFVSGPDGEGSTIRSVGVVGGTAVAAGGALAGGKLLLNLVSPLNRSAAGLSLAAVELQAAAVALRGAGAAGAAGSAAGGATRRRGMFGALGGPLTALNAFGLTQLDASSTQERFTNEIAPAVEEGFRAVVGDTFVDANNQRRSELEQAAAADDVSFFTRALASASGVPLPAVQPEAVQARISAEELAENNAKIGRLIGVLERNEAKILDPERSDPSRLSLINQNADIEDTIAGLGGEETLMQAFAAGTVTASEGLLESFEDGALNMEQTFANGTQAIQGGIDQSAMEFGPAAGEGLLAVAPQFGQLVGEAAAAAFGTINVQNNQQPQAEPARLPRMDRGGNTPF